MPFWWWGGGGGGGGGGAYKKKKKKGTIKSYGSAASQARDQTSGAQVKNVLSLDRTRRAYTCN